MVSQRPDTRLLCYMSTHVARLARVLAFCINKIRVIPNFSVCEMASHSMETGWNQNNGVTPAGESPYGAARSLVARLRGSDPAVPRPRTRVGVVLLAPKYLGREDELAVHLNADAVSLARRVRDAIPAGSAWVPISAATLLSHLDALAEAPFQVGQGNCWLVTHLDVLLAKLDAPERAAFWPQARANLPQRLRSLVLAFPASAQSLLPSIEEWKLWEEAKCAAATE